MRNVLTRLIFASAAALCLLASLPGSAATLRHAAMLHHPQVRLSDIFSSLPEGQDCDIGPAPAPGQSLSIGSAQLQAIAQQFGVEWSDPSGMAQSTLTRASRTILRADVMPQLLDELKKRGVKDDAVIDLTSFSAPTIAADQDVVPHLINLVYDASHGRFSAFFGLAGDTSPAAFRIDGMVSSHVDLLVAAHDLVAGEIISESDIRVLGADSRSQPTNALLDSADIVGRAARRSINAQTAFTTDLIKRVNLIEKGAPVVLDVSSSGLHLTASGVALDAGTQGERIHVLNPASKMVVIGQIVDRAHVAVTPGTTPTPAGSQELRYASGPLEKNT